MSSKIFLVGFCESMTHVGVSISISCAFTETITKKIINIKKRISANNRKIRRKEVNILIFFSNFKRGKGGKKNYSV